MSTLTISDLPYEIVVHICKFINQKDLIKQATVCKLFERVQNDSVFWLCPELPKFFQAQLPLKQRIFNFNRLEPITVINEDLEDLGIKENYAQFDLKFGTITKISNVPIDASSVCMKAFEHPDFPERSFVVVKAHSDETYTLAVKVIQGMWTFLRIPKTIDLNSINYKNGSSERKFSEFQEFAYIDFPSKDPEQQNLKLENRKNFAKALKAFALANGN